jgi:hypothetical protein
MMEAVANKDSPIVLLDNLEFIPIMHYAPPHLVSRMVFIGGPELNASPEDGMFVAEDAMIAGLYRGLLQFARGVPGRFENLSDFLSSHDTFLALCSPRSLGRLNYFIRRGAALRMESVTEDRFLVWVTFKQNGVRLQ